MIDAGIHLLSWDRTASVACTAQGIVTNGTDALWISCGDYICRGSMEFDRSATTRGRPISMVMHTCNTIPLDEVRSRLNAPDYSHISDGDYVELSRSNSRHRHTGELWFGLEGKNLPRVLPAALVRYNAETLEFIDIHPHPTMKTMPWLVFDNKRQVAYSANWTDNDGELAIFDAVGMEWLLDENVTLLELPEKFASGIDLVQGADMVGDTLYLMADNFESTLFAIELSEQENEDGEESVVGHVKDLVHLGLGYEREGIAVLDDCLLSMDNQWKTWEEQHFAEVVCVSMTSDTFTKGTGGSAEPFTEKLRGIGLVFGLILGLAVGFLIPSGVRCCFPSRANGIGGVLRPRPTYDGVESETPVTFSDVELT